MEKWRQTLCVLESEGFLQLSQRKESLDALLGCWVGIVANVDNMAKGKAILIVRNQISTLRPVVNHVTD